MKVRIDPENQNLEKRTLTIEFIPETEEDREIIRSYNKFQKAQEQLESEFIGKSNTANLRKKFVKRALELYGFSSDSYDKEEFEVEFISST